MDGENFMVPNPMKMDGLFHGKPYEQMDDLGVPLFLDIPDKTSPENTPEN